MRYFSFIGQASCSRVKLEVGIGLVSELGKGEGPSCGHHLAWQGRILFLEPGHHALDRLDVLALPLVVEDVCRGVTFGVKCEEEGTREKEKKEREKGRKEERKRRKERRREKREREREAMSLTSHVTTL